MPGAKQTPAPQTPAPVAATPARVAPATAPSRSVLKQPGRYLVRPAANFEAVPEGPSLNSGGRSPEPTPARRPRVAWQVEEDNGSRGSIFGGGFGVPRYEPERTPADAGSNPIRTPAVENDSPSLGGAETPSIDPAVEPEDTAPLAPTQPEPPALTPRDLAPREPAPSDAAPTAPVRPRPSSNFLPSIRERADDDCAARYNERNTCQENRYCREGFELIARAPLSEISLDITPAFSPDADSPEAAAKDVRNALGLNAFRRWRTADYRQLGIMGGQVIGLDGADWKSREGAGELVARYQKTAGNDFIVETRDGTTVKLPSDRLSLDDRYFVQGRPWRDRTGREVAFGRFVGLENAKVLVENNGSREELYVYDLGRDEHGYLAAYWGVPTECTLSDDPYEARNWSLVAFQWKASGVCHKPLYWEHIQLERYGHTYGPVLQPILSGAHFFGTAFVLPYKMGINPPIECQYSLGYYRPGSCAPHLIPPIPLSPRGALYQAAAVSGTALLLPF
jgi:hypothetical protein